MERSRDRYSEICDLLLNFYQDLKSKYWHDEQSLESLRLKLEQILQAIEYRLSEIRMGKIQD